MAAKWTVRDEIKWQERHEYKKKVMREHMANIAADMRGKTPTQIRRRQIKVGRVLLCFLEGRPIEKGAT